MKTFVVIGIVVVVIGSVGYFNFVADKKTNETTVRTAPVVSGPFTGSFLSRGKLIARKKQQLVALTSGIISDKAFSLGKFIAKGTTIATVRLLEPELRKKRQDLEYALLDLQILQDQLQQAIELLKAKAVSQKEVRELKTRVYKQERLVSNLREDITEKAIWPDFDGLLIEKTFRDGDRVGSGTVLATIVDTSSFAVELSVSQRHIANVVINQNVELRSQTFQGTRSGNVLEIARSATSRQGAQFGPGETEPDFVVLTSFERLPIDNVLLGAQLDGRFILQVKNETLSIPAEALLYRQDSSVVFVASQGCARKRIVLPGLSNDRFIEIVQGLTASDTVVTFGNLDVDDGMAIRNAQFQPLYDKAKPRNKPNFFAF
ncbi:MAG: RND transporter [Bacteroidetes bacterium]|nr:RND transporter [Bacteroidota bacterium]